MANAAVGSIISHWYTFYEGLEVSTQDFYDRVEQAITRREVPNCKVRKIKQREGGAGSAKRQYLRVQRKDHIFDICAAPFANGFFFSWWLAETPPGCMALIPYGIGIFLEATFKPTTYFKVDTALMFQAAIHNSVMEVIDEITKAKGLSGLSETERKPVLRELQS